MVVQAAGEMDGRKRFQKSIHIMKALGIDFGEPYRWGNYGPYSQSLASEIETMVASRYLHEEQDRYSQSYKYTLTKEGVEFLAQNSPMGNNENILNAITVLKSKNVEKLELLSTCLFVWRNDDTNESMVKLVKYLKPKYDESDIQNCVEMAGQIFNTIGILDKIDIIKSNL
jgi:uncharacterized protein YwgA